MRQNNTIFDDVFRTMIERMPSLIIPVINEVFQTSYSEDEKIEQYRNEHHTVSGEVITDSYFGIRNKLYHVECQSTQDSKMSIRMIEYDFAIALERAQEKEDSFEINFPHSCVLYLRHNKNTPEQLQVKVNMPDGEQVMYRIPTVKVQEYTRDEIFQKRLLFFLPYYIMRYERELRGISEEPSRLEELAVEYEEIGRRLGMMLAEEEKKDIYLRLMEVTKEISDYMLRREGKARERIGDIMGGKVLELEVDRMLERVESKRQEVERGRQELERGRQELENNRQEVERGRQELESKSQELENNRQELENNRQAIMEEGRREERYAKNKSIVTLMLQSGEPEEKILLYSGCTREELGQIRREMMEKREKTRSGTEDVAKNRRKLR